MLTLFPDEQLITESSGGEVTLTTHRLCYEYKEWGRAYNQNIMLEHITSCENRYNTHVWLLLLAGLCLLIGVVAGMGDNSVVLTMFILVAVVCFLAYQYTKSNFIIIASPSTKMKIKATGMKRERILEFINKVEQAKHKRVLSLNGRTN